MDVQPKLYASYKTFVDTGVPCSTLKAKVRVVQLSTWSVLPGMTAFALCLWKYCSTSGMSPQIL